MPEWNELFREEQYRWRVPHENVIRLAQTMKARGGYERVLDIGCGAGRHVVYLAGEGFEVTGLDNAENGLAAAREWLDRQGLQATLTLADMTVLPYPDGAFDAVISTYAIFHNTLAGMLQTMAETRRVLRPGGLAFFTLHSIFTYRYGMGEQIEPGTFIPSYGADGDVPHHFCDLADVARLFEGFKVSEVLLQESQDNEGHPQAHWAVTAARR